MSKLDLITTGDPVECIPSPDAYWSCIIGPVPRDLLPEGADAPMRRAVDRAVQSLIKEGPTRRLECFSGWGGKLTEMERASVEARQPDDDALVTESLEHLQRLGPNHAWKVVLQWLWDNELERCLIAESFMSATENMDPKLSYDEIALACIERLEEIPVGLEEAKEG